MFSPAPALYLYAGTAEDFPVSVAMGLVPRSRVAAAAALVVWRAMDQCHQAAGDPTAPASADERRRRTPPRLRSRARARLWPNHLRGKNRLFNIEASSPAIPNAKRVK